VTELPWCVVHGETFIDFLRRAHNGENPDLLFAEFYANSDREDVNGD
jgi:hypothetical protein